MAADSFSRFRRTLAHRADAEHKYREASYNQHERLVLSFYEWLQEQINRRVFGGVGQSDSLDVRLDHISLLETTWEQRRRIVEGIEKVFADRLTFRTI